MKIKREKIYLIMVTFSLIMSMISYEVHIFKYYTILQMLSSISLLIILFVFFKDKKHIKKLNDLNIQIFVFAILFFLMVANTVIGHIMFSYNSFSSAINVIMFACTGFALFYVIPIIASENIVLQNKIQNIIIIFGFCLSFFSILLHLSGNNLLGYHLQNYRNASFYYDPNFCATMMGSVFIVTLISQKKLTIKIPLLLFLGYSIYLTGSRGALLSMTISIFIYLFAFSNIKMGKRVIIFTLMASIAYYGFQYLYNTDYFRLYQGDNDRSLMLNYAIKMSQKSPIVGYGYQSISNALTNVTGLASTHNSYIDYLFAYGYPTFVIYIFFIIAVILKGMKYLPKENRGLLLLSFFLLINANSILYSFGGVGGISYIFTLALGIINIFSLKIKGGYKDVAQNRS